MPKGRDFKHEYLAYQGKPEQIKRRSNRNKARRKMIKAGRVRLGDGKDVAHKDNNPNNNVDTNLKAQVKSGNRSFKRKGPGGKPKGRG